MKNIFNENHFSCYKKQNLNESRERVCFSAKVTVFISHKHSDLGRLKEVIGFLEEKYKVVCYIDSRDQSMPQITSGETANKIKNRIKECDKFILLATSDAIESKWCNWELGFGDSEKLKNNNLAILPMQLDKDTGYKGNEYLDIYPHIVVRKKGDEYGDGTDIEPGYYIRKRTGEGTYVIEKLSKWLNK